MPISFRQSFGTLLHLLGITESRAGAQQYMSTLVLVRSGVTKSVFGKTIRDDESLIHRLKTFRPRKIFPQDANLDRSHVWPLLKNDVRLRRQRKLEQFGLAHWAKKRCSTHLILTNYEEHLETQTKERHQQYGPVDQHTEKLAYKYATAIDDWGSKVKYHVKYSQGNACAPDEVKPLQIGG